MSASLQSHLARKQRQKKK